MTGEAVLEMPPRGLQRVETPQPPNLDANHPMWLFTGKLMFDLIVHPFRVAGITEMKILTAQSMTVPEKSPAISVATPAVAQ